MPGCARPSTRRITPMMMTTRTMDWMTLIEEEIWVALVRTDQQPRTRRQSAWMIASDWYVQPVLAYRAYSERCRGGTAASC